MTERDKPAVYPVMKVLLLGYGHLGEALLRGLSACDGCEIVGVFRWSSLEKPGHHQHAATALFDDTERALAELVRTLGVRDLRSAGANSYEFIAELQRLKPDLLLIGSWGEILKPHVLEFPGLTVINCHPSKLPAHRGANPYASAIRAGDTEGGVTFHLTTPAVDAGDIILQATVPIGPHDTGGDLREKCARVAGELVPELMRLFTAHKIQGAPLPATPQDESQSSLHPMLSMEDGRLDWRLPPQTLYDQCRAIQPWLDCYGYVAHPTPGHGRLLTFKRLTMEPHSTSGEMAPGTILARTPKVLWVASAEPGTRLALSNYRLQLGQVLLPPWLSRQVSGFLLQPGQRVESYP